ncbi:MAG: hypothetical protein KatS3mg058_2802 [Roseiflexus sp.]|nr:MAG: hypothetical protein KatS3mg058_2802 [Roseiflexus sp.]
MGTVIASMDLFLPDGEPSGGIHEVLICEISKSIRTPGASPAAAGLCSPSASVHAGAHARSRRRAAAAYVRQYDIWYTEFDSSI